jgi:hypothetical protein
MQLLGRDPRRENASACQHVSFRSGLPDELTFVFRSWLSCIVRVPDIVRRAQPAPTSSREQRRTNRN